MNLNTSNFKYSEILLRRKNLILIKPNNANYSQNEGEKALVISGLKNVQALGFSFSKELLEIMFHLTKEEFEDFYKMMLPVLKELAGADVEYNPMYPSFPQQVADASDVDLFINAIIHYWSFGEIIPEYKKDTRLPLIEQNDFKVISIGSENDLMDVFTNLVNSKTSISQQDKDDISFVIRNYSNYDKYLPQDIPFKENIALIGKLVIENAAVKDSKAISSYFKTATDVLRLITAMSDGDISLAKKTKFKKFSRSERRIIMDLLANCHNLTEDMFRYKNEWLRVGEIIHPFEFKNQKYKYVVNAFNSLRNEKKPLMYAGALEQAKLQKDTYKTVELLLQRPGEFARNLDKVLRDAQNTSYVIDNFIKVVDKVAVPVLIQVRQHFISKFSEKDAVRVFFPKGVVAKTMLVDNTLPEIEEQVCKQIVCICEQSIIKQFKDKPEMGKVYIDEDLKNYIVPFSQRSASKTVKTLVRGSRVSLNDRTNIIRPFIWWTNCEDRVDIDLSAAFYDKDWNVIKHISYTNLRNNSLKAYHSGDITNGGNPNGKGAAEFIDIDIDSVLKAGCQYIVFQCYSFTNQRFMQLPNCRFGWMEREDSDNGEIFEPSTVQMKIDLTSDSTIAIPVIFDCTNKQFIWCDTNISNMHTYYGGNNLESNLNGISAIAYAMTHLNKANLYDLIYMNAVARGEITTDRNKADIIFSNDKTVPYEVVTEIDKLTKISKRVVKDKEDVPIITAYDIDYAVGQLL